MQVFPITFGKKNSNDFYELCLAFDVNDARKKIAKHANELGSKIDNEHSIVFEKKIIKNIQTGRNDLVRIATVGNFEYYMWQTRPGNVSRG